MLPCANRDSVAIMRLHLPCEEANPDVASLNSDPRATYAAGFRPQKLQITWVV
jgi:hypothetical protein